MINEKYYIKSIFIYIVSLVTWFIISVYTCNDSMAYYKIDVKIQLLNIISTLYFFFIIFNIKRMNNGHIISLYFFFFLFLYIFSFGQFLMWTFGIHYISEMMVSHHVRYIDSYTVLRIQVISLMLISAFHLGYLLSIKKYKPKGSKLFQNKDYLNLLKKLSFVFLLLSFAINFYYSITAFNNAAINGYSALFEIDMPALFKYLSYCFVPCIYLNIVLNNFSKKSFVFLSIIFLLYAVPLLIAGDRGSWIYFLGPWFWIYIRFVNNPSGDNKKMTRRRTVLAASLILLLFFISSAFVSVRHEGYSRVSQDTFDIHDLYRPFIKPIFEMGQSARVLGIIVEDKLDTIYPYGNTYIADVLGMVIPRTKLIFGFPGWYVENWFSSSYLHMENYGVGFSAFGEAYLNGGLYFSWIYMIIYGFFIGKLVYIKDNDVAKYPIKTYIALSATTILGPSVRATMDLWLREFFWGVLFILLISSVIWSFRSSKNLNE